MHAVRLRTTTTFRNRAGATAYTWNASCAFVSFLSFRFKCTIITGARKFTRFHIDLAKSY